MYLPTYIYSISTDAAHNKAIYCTLRLLLAPHNESAHNNLNIFNMPAFFLFFSVHFLCTEFLEYNFHAY